MSVDVELLELARKASDKEWSRLTWAASEPFSGPKTAYIYAANPSTIISLCEELQLLRQMIAGNLTDDGTTALREDICFGCREQVGIGGHSHEECCPFVGWRNRFQEVGS